MIFDKNVRRICAFCEKSTDFDECTVLCQVHGPVSATSCCRRFVYDPLRRQPAPPPKPKKPYSTDDFTLD